MSLQEKIDTLGTQSLVWRRKLTPSPTIALESGFGPEKGATKDFLRKVNYKTLRSKSIYEAPACVGHFKSVDRCRLKNRLSTIKALPSETQVRQAPDAILLNPRQVLPASFQTRLVCMPFYPQSVTILIRLFRSLRACLVVLLAVEYSEDGKEQVDDVQVKRDGRSNFLFNVIMAHNELGIHQDISTEDERCHGPVDKLGSAIVGKEGCHKSKKDEHP